MKVYSYIIICYLFVLFISLLLVIILYPYHYLLGNDGGNLTYFCPRLYI